MEKRIPMSCNLRFNQGNERHMKAAQVLSMVGRRYKTAFITLAIETYLDINPMGIDMNALMEVQRNKTRSGPPKTDIQSNIQRKMESAESKEAIECGMSYYDID